MMANKLQFGGDGRLSAGRERLHVREQSGKQEPPDRGCGLQHVTAPATVSSSTRTRRTTNFADLKGKLVSVPFGSAAHGMMLKAMQDRGWPADYLPAGQPESGGRLDQSSGEEDRRPRRLRAVRRTAAVPRLRPQDLRRRRDQPADLARRRGPHRLRREVSRGRRRLHQGDHRRQRLAARRSQAGGRENRGMDRHQQGSGLHLPRSRAAT